MKTLRATWRLIRFLASLFWHALPLWIRAAGSKPIDWDHHHAVRMKFAKSAMRILGIDLHVDGEPYRGGACVYASNHRSWLDPFMHLSVVRANPVAKASVAKLPIVAQGGKATGLLFVNRGDKNSRSAVIEQMVDTIRFGHSILIYPEGTTSNEPATKTFQRGAFIVAAEAQCPVVPMAVVYPDPSYHWGDGESLWKNFVQVAGEKHTKLKLMIGRPINVGEAGNGMANVRRVIDEYIHANS